MPKRETISVQIGGAPRAPGAEPALLLALRADRPRAPPLLQSLAGVHKLLLGRGEPGVTRLEEGVLAWNVDDGSVSSRHAELTRTGEVFTVADLGSKNGTLAGGRKVREATLRDGDVLELGHCFFVLSRAPPAAAEPLVTWNPGLAAKFAQLRKIAASKVPVVLRGETGSGKEVVASAVHALSGRAGAFQAVNCAAIAPALLEAELFGHVKGAFSGAVADRPGLIRAAQGGTLFLDEFAELSLPAQATLLRALQESEVLPVGATRPVKVDFRLVVATHGDLEALAEAGRLRHDLLARVSGFSLTLPPLRERREDLGMLAARLLERHGRPQATFAIDAARALFLHGWPRNIRELEKALTAALALSSGRIEAEHLPPEVRAALNAPSATRLSARDEALRAQLTALLREHRGNVAAVARAMGKFRTQVNRWLRRLDLHPEQFR